LGAAFFFVTFEPAAAAVVIVVAFFLIAVFRTGFSFSSTSSSCAKYFDFKPNFTSLFVLFGFNATGSTFGFAFLGFLVAFTGEGGGGSSSWLSGISHMSFLLRASACALEICLNTAVGDGSGDDERSCWLSGFGGEEEIAIANSRGTSRGVIVVVGRNSNLHRIS
jgi:hypothetical protein